MHHISIHAPHAGRDPARARRAARENISIHAPHAGRDSDLLLIYSLGIISIHAPHAGRDSERKDQELTIITFQSTRPMRGATAKVYKITLNTFATKGNS